MASPRGGRVLVQMFPQPRWVETVSCDGKPCGGASACGAKVTAGGNCQSSSCGGGGGGGCGPVETLVAFARRHADAVDAWIADYGSLPSIERSLAELNRILEANSEDLRVTLENLELVFSQVSPIVAVDGHLAFVGRAPTEAELEEATGLSPA